MIIKVIKKMTVPLILYGGLFIFLLSTNPHKLPIGWLLVPFVWLFVALLWTFRTILSYTRRDKPSSRVTLTSVFAALLPTLALLLDSVNQLTVRDLILLVGFGLVGFFYASRLNFAR